MTGIACLRCLLAVLLFIALAGRTAVPTYAFERDMAYYMVRQYEATGVMDTSDPLAWMQGKVPYTPDRYLKAGTSGDRVGSGGCSYFAAAYMLLKMGQLDIRHGENPITVLDKMEAIRGWLTWGKMDFSRINEAYPEVTCEGYKKRFASSKFSEQVQAIRDLMADGYFVIVCLDGPHSHGHYVFVDEVLDDDDMVIGDSAYEGTNWNDTHLMAGAYLVDYSIFRCGDLKPADCPSIYKYNLQEYNDPAKADWYSASQDEESAWNLSGGENKSDSGKEKPGSGKGSGTSGNAAGGNTSGADGSSSDTGSTSGSETIELPNGHEIIVRGNRNQHE